ncbi:uncharacterized protein LOC136063149 [Quercus suber]|uniref:uncharacterized protein LOC136063149 n=1 Tax=Quercus suber TaxID=58331 RepID=UPI0032DF4982
MALLRMLLCYLLFRLTKKALCLILSTLALYQLRLFFFFFYHVFVGEIKQRGEQEVSGFHNWLQFYLEEAKGRVDYQGYIFPRRRGQTPDYETQLLTVQFEWNGVLKSVSSMFVGVSPEFEVALYALCFYMGGEDNYIQLGPYPVNIKCYHLGDRIGSVFPIAEC